MSNIRNLLEKMDQFAGQAVGQKPGDQVRGTDKATRKKSGEHPFKGRLVGASESTGSLLQELQLELNKPEATVRRDLFREFAEYRQDVAEGSAGETPQQQKVRTAISNGLAKSSQMGKSEYQSQPTKRTYFDNAGYASDKLTGIDSIDPDGTVVISMGDTKAANWVKKLATLGGMPGVKTREVQPQKQGVAEEDAWHSSEDAPQDAWHSSQDAPQDAWHGATAESEGDAEGLPHLTTELVGNILQQMKTHGPQAISKSIEWGDGAATELTDLIRNALEDYLNHADLDEEIAAPMTPGVAPTAPAANTAANPAAVAQMKAQQLKTLAAQKKSTQDQIKQTQEQLDALRKQLASLSNPANVAMPSVTGTV